MTRKDYIAIAAILKNARDNDALGIEAVNSIAQDLADHFTEDNPNFDRSRWFRAVEGR